MRAPAQMPTADSGQVRDVDQRPGQIDGAQAQHAAQVDTVPQRRGVGERAEPAGQLGDREERAGEQQQRHHAEPEQEANACLGLSVTVQAAIGGGEGEPGEHRGRAGQHRPRRTDRAERAP